jgi:hypothetical protein
MPTVSLLFLDHAHCGPAIGVIVRCNCDVPKALTAFAVSGPDPGPDPSRPDTIGDAAAGAPEHAREGTPVFSDVLI